MFIEFNRAFRDRIEMKTNSKNYSQQTKKKQDLKTMSSVSATNAYTNKSTTDQTFHFSDLSQDLNKFNDN
jgi:hypothetical protein